MRILFVGAYTPYPLNSGGRIRSYHLLRELSNHCEVHLLAFSHGEMLGAEQATLERVCRSITTIPAPFRPEGIGSRIRRLLRSPDDIVMQRNSPELERELDLCLDAAQWDLVILDDMGVERYFQRIGDRPVLLSKHNCEWRLLARSARQKGSRLWARSLAWLEALAVRRCELRAASQSQRVIVVSETERQWLLNHIPQAKVDVAPNGVDSVYFIPTSETEEEEDSLLFTGALFWHPNVDGIVWFCESIWPLIRSEMPNARFHLVGCEPSEAVHRMQKLPGVRVSSNVPDIRPYMSRASAYVVPLRIGSGTRLKILEALAAGKAVVATSVGAEGLDLVADRELLIADSAKDFADTCVTLLRDRAKRAALGLTGRRTIENLYHWSVTLGDLNRICAEASSGKGTVP